MSKWDELKAKGNERYKSGNVEPIDLYKSGELLRDFAIGCIIKYAFRNRTATEKKLNLDDLEKIIHYAEMLKVLAEEGE